MIDLGVEIMADFEIEDFENDEGFISLTKIMGCKIKDIDGFIDDPFDNGVLVLRISKIYFEDGRSVFMEGEHDVVYIPSDDKIPELSEDFFEKLND